MSLTLQKFRQTLLITLLFATPGFCLNPTADQWVALPAYSGGINIMANRSQIEQGQLLSASNFIWKDGQLQGREGFYRYVAPLSANPVAFIDVFKASTGAKYLMYSDGVNLWYRPELTGTSVALEFGRSNSGVVDTWATIVGGDAISTQKWRTIFGTGEGLTMTIGGVDYTVDKILLDTLVWLTSTAGSTTDQSYNIDYSAIGIQSRLVVSDNYWIYANTGKSYFNRPDSFVVVDSLLGSRSTYTSTSRRCTGNLPTLRFASALMADNNAGKFLRIVSNPNSAGGAKGQVTGGHSMYLSYPISVSGGGAVLTHAAAFQPDSGVTQYFTVEQLSYDSTTKFVTQVDSIRLLAADSANFSCSGTGYHNNAFYLKLWCDTCFFDSDTTAFITGDWFFYPQYEFTVRKDQFIYHGDGSIDTGFTCDSECYATMPTNALSVYPVVGGFRGANEEFYIAVPPLGGSREDHELDGNGVNVAFYRMKKNTSGLRSGGYVFAVLHNERVFEVRSDEPDRFYYSEPFLPDSFLAGSVTIVDQANPCVIAAKQWSDLVVYTTAGSWRVIADATAENYGTEKLNTSRGCVSRGSFLNIDNVHYGLAADGFWECDGNEPRLISDAVSTYFLDSLNQSEYEEVRSGYDAENDNIWISFPRVGSMTNSITLVYHRATKSWWRQSFVAGSYAYNPDVNVSDSVRFMAGGIDSSTIYVRGGRLDDGATITASLQTPYLDFGDPIISKRVKSMILGYDSQVASAFSVYGFRDFALTPFDTVSFTTGTTWAQKWLYFPDARYNGNNLSLQMSISNASLFKLPYLRLQVIPEGEEE